MTAVLYGVAAVAAVLTVMALGCDGFRIEQEQQTRRWLLARWCALDGCAGCLANLVRDGRQASACPHHHATRHDFDRLTF